jgi:hypothetical protein
MKKFYLPSDYFLTLHFSFLFSSVSHFFAFLFVCCKMFNHYGILIDHVKIYHFTWSIMDQSSAILRNRTADRTFSSTFDGGHLTNKKAKKWETEQKRNEKCKVRNEAKFVKKKIRCFAICFHLSVGRYLVKILYPDFSSDCSIGSWKCWLSLSNRS